MICGETSLPPFGIYTICYVCFQPRRFPSSRPHLQSSSHVGAFPPPTACRNPQSRLCTYLQVPATMPGYGKYSMWSSARGSIFRAGYFLTYFPTWYGIYDLADEPSNLDVPELGALLIFACGPHLATCVASPENIILV